MAASPSGSLRSLRELNRLRVLETLRHRGSISRAEIARQTGLSRSTVSSLVSDLQAAGLVVERGDAPPGGGMVSAQSGRPPVFLTLAPGAGAVVGLQFDHAGVRVAVSDLSYEIRAEREVRLDVDNDAAAAFDIAARLADEVLAEAGVDRDQALGAGVGIAGPIARGTGTVGSSSILPGWVGINARDELAGRLGMPVHVDNDANLGALAELVLGAGRNASELVYLMLSSGIGGGLILDGRLYRGASGTAGELGHVVLDDQGPMCRCGNRGCLETFASIPALLDLLRRSHGDELTGRDVLALAHDGDPGCRRALADAGRAAGRALASVCNQFNPQRIVVGGELSGAGDLLMDPLREALARFALPAATDGVDVVVAELGARAQLLGALVLVAAESDRAFSRRVRAAVGA